MFSCIYHSNICNLLLVFCDVNVLSFINLYDTKFNVFPFLFPLDLLSPSILCSKPDRQSLFRHSMFAMYHDPLSLSFSKYHQRYCDHQYLFKCCVDVRQLRVQFHTSKQISNRPIIKKVHLMIKGNNSLNSRNIYFKPRTLLLELNIFSFLYFYFF